MDSADNDTVVQKAIACGVPAWVVAMMEDRMARSTHTYMCVFKRQIHTGYIERLDDAGFTISSDAFKCAKCMRTDYCAACKKGLAIGAALKTAVVYCIEWSITPSRVATQSIWSS